MTSRKVTHLRDIRSYNNEGVSVPVCEPGLLASTTGHIDKVTCKRCLKLGPKRYAWAYPNHVKGAA